jgi:hypothetical protein
MPVSCGTSSWMGSGVDWWLGSQWAWLRGRYSGVVCVQQLEACVAEGQVSHWVWVWHGALAWCSPRGGVAGRMEQWLCRPMGWGFGRLTVLLLDSGMEKPSMI